MQAFIDQHTLPMLSEADERWNHWQESYRAYQERFADFQRQQAGFQDTYHFWQERHRIFRDLQDTLKQEKEKIRWRRLSRGFPFW